MAEAANQQGNAAYKEGNYINARKFFAEATKFDHKEPKYPSNLSAVLYELGRYPECIKAIYLSWQRLESQNMIDGKPSMPPELEPLGLKLATRFAKAKSNGYSSKTISLHAKPPVDAAAAQNERVVNTLEADIENFATLERAGHVDARIKDIRSAWAQWRAIRDHCSSHTAKECKAELAAAETCLRAMPIFKSPSDPTLEFFTFGHDEVQSLMNGINGSSFDDCCLDSPMYKDQQDWTFLFGGSGDGRHVFGTFMHLADMANETGMVEQLDLITVHMTLMDVHPASLARIIIVLALLRQILEARLSKDKARRLELYTTLFYLYTSMLMPDYCRQIIMDTAKTLVDELPRGIHSLSKCLNINEQSYPAILDVLRYWSTPLAKSTKIFIQRSADSMAYFINLTAQIGAKLNLSKPAPESLKKGSNSNPRSGPLDAYNDPDAEAALFKRVRVLLPPKPFLSRHPALAQLVKSYKSAPDSLYAAAMWEIEETWKPNPTLFDKHSTEHRELADHGGYPGVSTNPFDSLTSYTKFASEFQRGSPPAFCRGTTGFAVTTQFFDLVADAIWELQNTLKVEVVVSEVMTGVSKLFAGELGRRPKDFPVDYTRIWLSNVPDYTNGMLNTAVHLVPHLEPRGLAMSNCLLNTGNWPTIADYCYNYTLLRPHDVPRILGCEVINPQSSGWDDIAVRQIKLPLPLDKLASKKELHTWLAHLLLCILCNGVPKPPPSRVDLPNNLGAFFHVLVHLHRVGFPSHWIGDFVQSVVSDNLVTDVAPYLGRLPIPMTEVNKRKASRRIYLDAWQAELQVILASTKAALPFSVAVPPEYPSWEDIRIYKATVEPVNLQRNPLSRYWGPLTSPFTRAIGLIFYRPTGDLDADALAHRVPAILEGDREVHGLKVQIMLSQEKVDLGKGELSWKMSKSWYEKMKAEKWKMAAYRTDLTVASTELVGADQWSEVL
ncbi:hypothetical protein BDZ97DRAFT_1914492 [Flammula alnicola]|nr:hypothetical protein BDZ97DRAFT_1914492 [Flammula alnicola]